MSTNIPQNSIISGESAFTQHDVQRLLRMHLGHGLFKANKHLYDLRVASFPQWLHAESENSDLENHKKRVTTAYNLIVEYNMNMEQNTLTCDKQDTYQS